jgi:tRNA dimethylallyltransferase
MERALSGAGDPLLAVILGATGSGKTALSLALAEQFAGEIVNCDSVAMYREFEIGTAKPTTAERARAPHHLFDCVSPTGYITAGEYARMGRQKLEEIKSRGRLPIVAGGTGLYLRSLLDGLFPGPQRSEELRERLRKRANEKGSNYLRAILQRIDAAAADKIHGNDTPKLIRAIEVCLATRKRMSELWVQQGRDPIQGFRVLRLGLDPPREQLYARINQRAEEMFANGLVEETRSLMARYREVRALGSLGYKQAVGFIRGDVDFAAAVAATQQAHRNYAKRQMTWFRREPNVLWLKGFGDEQSIQEAAIAVIREQS